MIKAIWKEQSRLRDIDILFVCVDKDYVPSHKFGCNSNMKEASNCGNVESNANPKGEIARVFNKEFL